MIAQITATFTNGVFVPTTPVPLEDESTVKLTVETQVEPTNAREAFERFLKHVKANPFNSGGDYVTRDELYESR